MNTILWLHKNGGPAIQLRLLALRDSRGVEIDKKCAVSALLDVDDVRLIMEYFDAFKTTDRHLKTLEHLIHYYKDTCLETFFPRVMDYGFRAGIEVFDEKMIPVADTFKYVYAMANGSNKLPNRQAYFNFSLMMHRYFYVTDFLFPELVESVEKRLNAIHEAAIEKISSIYQDETKLPKKPSIWENVPILKDEMNPWKITAKKPLPMWFDIWTFAHYVDKCTEPDKIKKINEIIEFVLDPEFQKTEGNGLLYVPERKIYHANNLGLSLPLYKIQGHPARSNPSGILETLDMMSHFETARKSEWFHDCLNHLEQFKTEKGTYQFPKEYLHKKYVEKAFLSENNISLKRNEREMIKREIVSTIKILEIYERIS